MLQANFWMAEAKVHLRWQLALQCLEGFNLAVYHTSTIRNHCSSKNWTCCMFENLERY